MFESLANLSKEDFEQPFEKTLEWQIEDSQSLGRASVFDVWPSEKGGSIRESSIEKALLTQQFKPASNNMINLENIIMLESRIQEIYDKISGSL